MSTEMTSKVWEISCPYNEKFMMLAISECSSSNGETEWWIMDLDKINDMTHMGMFLVSSTLEELMWRGVIEVDYDMSARSSDCICTVDVDLLVDL